MAVARLKDPAGATVRTAEVKSANGIRCEVSVPGGHTFFTDEPAERGGTDTAAAPLLYFTASLATCQTVQIHKVAKAMRIDHGTINIHVETTTDRVPGIDGSSKVMRFCHAEMVVDIETDAPRDKVERLMKLAEDQCPVGNLFADAGYPPVLTFNILPMPK
jgi:putative redox protein